MIESVTAQEMQRFSHYTTDEIGVHPLVLMERAAISVMEVLGAGTFDLTNVLVIAGLGNNGGDGIAVTRMLAQKGVNVDLLLLGDEHRATPNTAKQLDIARKYGIMPHNRVRDFRHYTVIVDALFGAGLSKPVPVKLGEIIKRVNAANIPVVSIDIPSGLNATSGAILGSAIRASATVTFAYPKKGLLQNEGLKRAGNIYVKDIGVYSPEELSNFKKESSNQ
ncbi:NAD(P)H-hydrate epimerase [Weissella paramesenteroides]|jgi:NAD(P)H-hydrate epimerase|uniref:NAD(P)H-hydrate epimerase n=1 Tax=Weissella paramesenteroides TaxID=1249 RepID=A0A5M9ELI8_WEIPA|nr:NAD(P)H-hydrate epimerase [Weissella paramesenteroides]KAA8439794.1 NAD(P)H-hydrate epimerase [Weissella paramesenteroides]KAA8441449.1 NAD(P)H-hydrate epimerase [Weissella paramesenteroides]KAA8444191.1 NAD(P)H-hydrate epimerase [Weissella paramesenteroides]KAA8445908.1 NAD(P)H-hydrate epimerase [Weissella paramesenteroides]KAA8448603.1 NAD(P)H-hydrate epimerase [Weissella paramesenteroides]